MNIKSIAFIVSFCLCILLIAAFQPFPAPAWESKLVSINKDGSLTYHADEKGNTIPDFSRVGYGGGDSEVPGVAVIRKITPTGTDNDEINIQSVIDEVSKLPLDKNGIRGAILLTRGTYKIPTGIHIQASGIVLRGEGSSENDTRLIATTQKQDALISITGSGNIQEIPGTRAMITDNYVPVGATSFTVSSTKAFKAGDRIIVYRPGTDTWIKDLKMDQIEGRDGTKQWTAKEYNLQFERVITKVTGNTISIDNPIVMAMETKYGGGEIFSYHFPERISKVGVENLYCESKFESDTAENHAWDAVSMNKIENGWVTNVTARYFAYSCVNLGGLAKNITVSGSKCFDHKSVITGGRRYSFCNNGQLNLFINCSTADGRHDYVTGARVCGPNVFVNCTAVKTHADIGPHHRWSMGTLYDNIITDGEINIQDRGNWGSGHGWSGVTQIAWNCTVKEQRCKVPGPVERIIALG